MVSKYIYQDRFSVVASNYESTQRPASILCSICSPLRHVCFKTTNNVLGTLSGGNHAWRETCLEGTLPGGNPAWREPCLEGTLPGGNPVWREPCLEGTLSGGNPVWREPCLEGTLSGENPVWREPCLEGTLSGENPVWREPCLEGTLSGGNPVSSQLHMEIVNFLYLFASAGVEKKEEKESKIEKQPPG